MAYFTDKFTNKHYLQSGQQAPNFLAVDVKGTQVELNYNRSGYLLLAFLRYAGCPWCNLAIHRLTLEHELLRKSGCSVVAFVQSSKDNIIKNIYERHEHVPDFPVIADHTMEVYRRYGVQPSALKTASMMRQVPHWVRAVSKGFTNSTVDGSLFLAPATFLLSPYARDIVRADYNANLFEHDTFTNLYESMAYHKINN